MTLKSINAGPPFAWIILLLVGIAAQQAWPSAGSATTADIFKRATVAETTAFLTAYSSSSPPHGFAGVCHRYPWACSTRQGVTAASDALRIAKKINREVNMRIRSVSDRQLYGVVDRWALPTRGAGDCEDYALLKKKLLLEAGVAGRMLLLATALNRRAEPHAVLVLRLPTGDMILDNQTSTVKPWQRTGHTYLKIQSPDNPLHWHSVLLGPLASRTSQQS